MEAKRAWSELESKGLRGARKQKLPCEQDTKRAKDCLVSPFFLLPFCAVSVSKCTSYWAEEKVKFREAAILHAWSSGYTSSGSVLPVIESVTAQAQRYIFKASLELRTGFQALESGLFAEFANRNTDWDGIVGFTSTSHPLQVICNNISAAFNWKRFEPHLKSPEPINLSHISWQCLF